MFDFFFGHLDPRTTGLILGFCAGLLTSAGLIALVFRQK